MVDPQPASGQPPERRQPQRLEETDEGSVLFNVPFPTDLSQLKGMSPIIVKWPYQINYIHSFGQDSPFFAGLANRKLLGTRCPRCGAAFGTPRLRCMRCGGECDWFELPRLGRVHTWTTCYFSGEVYLDETPFHLILVEWDDVDTLFLSRLVGCETADISIGMLVEARFRRNSKFNVADVYFVPAARQT